MDKKIFFRAIGGRKSRLVREFSIALEEWDPSIREVHSNDRHLIVTRAGRLLMTGLRIRPNYSLEDKRIWEQIKDILSPGFIGGLVLSDDQIEKIAGVARVSTGFIVMNPKVIRDKAIAAFGEGEAATAAIERMVDRFFEGAEEEEISE